MTYRDYDGLKRGKRGGVSSHNTREDWANYYRRGREKARQDMEEGYRQRLIKERTEPKKFPSNVIDFIPSDKGCYKASLFYNKRENLLYFYRGNYREYYPKIGCPILLTLDDELEYCCEITNYNEKELEVLVCVNNEKLVFPFEYGSVFLGIGKSSLGSIGIKCRIPFHLFDDKIK